MPLDSQVHQGHAARRQEHAIGRPRHSRIRLQESCLDRSRLRRDLEHVADARGRPRSARLEGVLDRMNTASNVWADTAYRLTKNEVMLRGAGSCRASIARCRPVDRSLIASASPTRRNRNFAATWSVTSAIRRVRCVVVQTIGIARGTFKIGIANLAYNMRLRLAEDEIRRVEPRRLPYSQNQGGKSHPSTLATPEADPTPTTTASNRSY